MEKTSADAKLGSAKKGTQHWLAERVTAIALVPLTLWLVASVIADAAATKPSSSPG
jgi:succinate dehydrogenase / fumarate reductase membrane anchor subunit